MSSTVEFQARRFRARRWIWLLCGLGALAIATLSYVLLVNPLPTDEELIAHFKSHRQDIEELLRRYREYRVPPGERPRELRSTAENEALMERAGVADIKYAGHLWLPNPYSEDTAQKREVLVRQPGAVELPRQYGAIDVHLNDPRYVATAWRYPSMVWKDLYHIPEVPRIQDGRLLAPAAVGRPLTVSYRVLDSLNKFAVNWQRGECVVRQIEQHWFLLMCRAA